MASNTTWTPTALWPRQGRTFPSLASTWDSLSSQISNVARIGWVVPATNETNGSSSALHSLNLSQLRDRDLIRVPFNSHKLDLGGPTWDASSDSCATNPCRTSSTMWREEEKNAPYCCTGVADSTLDMSMASRNSNCSSSNQEQANLALNRFAAICGQRDFLPHSGQIRFNLRHLSLLLDRRLQLYICGNQHLLCTFEGGVGNLLLQWRDRLL